MACDSVLRPMAEPLRMAANEVADLSRMSDALQSTIARIVACQGSAPVALVMEAQAADLLSQRLAGVAAFLSALADAAPAEARMDVAAATIGLTLAEQARRLAGCPNQAPEPELDGGDLMLFGD